MNGTSRLDDGSHLDGDWVVTNRETYFARDFGGGGGPAKAMYFISSRSKVVCAVDADKPNWVYCTGGLASNTRVTGAVRLSGSTALDHGALTIDVEQTTPSFADELMIFERVTGKSLAARLAATVQRSGKVLELEAPFVDVQRCPPIRNSRARPP